VQRRDETLLITPWAFETNRVTVTVEVRRLDQLTFGNDMELKAALETAPVDERVWTFCR